MNKTYCRFEKVSYKVFSQDLPIEVSNDIKEIFYNELKLPKRATKGSAGYDFFAPYSFKLEVGESVKIPTGIRVFLEDDKVLKCYPRSGHGFKFKAQLDNTVGIIDSDYYYSNNEGHIWAKITNDGREGKTLEVKQGEAFMQGIIVQFFVIFDDDSEGIRNGGLGSTTNK